MNDSLKIYKILVPFPYQFLCVVAVCCSVSALLFPDSSVVVFCLMLLGLVMYDWVYSILSRVAWSASLLATQTTLELYIWTYMVLSYMVVIEHYGLQCFTLSLHCHEDQGDNLVRWQFIASEIAEGQIILYAKTVWMNLVYRSHFTSILITLCNAAFATN